MSKYYGIVTGSARSQVTRRGSASSGLSTIAASWSGAIRTRLFDDSEGIEWCEIDIIDWPGGALIKTLYRGRIDRCGQQKGEDNK